MVSQNGQRYIIEAYDIAIDGNGIARLPESDMSEMQVTHIPKSGEKNGKLVFCPNLLPGESAQVQIIEERKKYANATVIQYLKKADIRKSVKCEVFDNCGGCVLLHVSYEKQLKIKRDHVLSCLSRIGKFAESEIKSLIHPILGMENPYSYRNHVQYQAEEKNDEFCLGFYAKKTNKVIVHADCCLVPEICNKIQAWFLNFCLDHKTYGQNRNKENGMQRLTVRMGFYTGDIMLMIEKRGGLHFPAEKCAEFIQYFIDKDENLKAQKWKVKSIWEKTDEKHSKYKHLWGTKHIEEQIGKQKYIVSPSSFFQVNTQQTLVLYNQIKDFVLQVLPNNLQQYKGKLIDLYCGTGTIGLHLADISIPILGVEINAEAISDAWQNARRNGVENCEYIQGKTEDAEFHINFDDVVILDPPRRGCDKHLLNFLLNSMPRSIIYVSCDPATLARDLRILVDGGYVILAVQPVDMFPWTGHVETIVLMSTNINH